MIPPLVLNALSLLVVENVRGGVRRTHRPLSYVWCQPDFERVAVPHHFAHTSSIWVQSISGICYYHNSEKLPLIYLCPMKTVIPTVV